MTAPTRAAIVTGGSRGIGRAIALRLARQGIAVAVNFCTGARAAQDVVEQIAAAGGAAIACQADVRDAGRAILEALDLAPEEEEDWGE